MPAVGAGRALSFQGLVRSKKNADSRGLCDVAHCADVHATLPCPAGVLFTSLLVCPMLSPMFGKPRQLETEAQVYDAAIKILMRRRTPALPSPIAEVSRT